MRCCSFRRLSRGLVVLTTVVALVAGCGADEAPPTESPTESSAPADPALVDTATGRVRGVVAPDHRLFANIPYAAPPVGPLRWQPPAPAAAWEGVRDATKFGPHCLQDTGANLEMGRQVDEDCLTLNVWTPPVESGEVSNEPRPVMFWIHGGSFVAGNGNMYDSAWLASRGDIVVVTVNYRLSASGFLAHPALGPAGSVGNYGLLDQQAALRWVRDNIATFGGDPDKVTIAGESAGGMSVCDHLVAPESKGLFRAAIIQSGPCQAQIALPDAERISIDWARDAGCADPATAAACLRALPADKLRKPVWYGLIGENKLSGPVFGSAALPEDPVVAIREGRAVDVPVLIGSNRDEFTLFPALQYMQTGRLYTAQEYPGLLAGTFGDHAAAVGARYPLDRYNGNATLAYAAAVTDGVFACVDDRMAREMAGDAPVYAYEFNDPAAPAPEPMRTLPFPIGASHSLELRYLFDVGDGPPLDPAQKKLSEQMIDYWSHFVATGSPDAPGQPAWPATSATEDERMTFQPDGSRVETNFDDVHQCGFWAGVQR